MSSERSILGPERGGLWELRRVILPPGKIKSKIRRFE